MREVAGDVARIVARWLFWRPWRPVAAVVAVLLLAGLVSTVTGGRSRSVTAQTSVTASSRPRAVQTRPAPVEPTTPAPTTTASSSVPSVHPTLPAPAPPPSTLTIAATFTRAWAAHPKTAGQWVAGMSRWTTPRLLAQFRRGDPANVPANKVTGPPRAGEAGGRGLAAVSVPTDGGVVQITLRLAGGRWLVDTVNLHR